MYNLEQLLASKILSEQQIKKLTNIQILPDEKGEVWLYFEVIEKKSSKKENEETTKSYKKNITELVVKHGGLENLYYAQIAVEMLSEGYTLIAIEGGWIVHGGEEPYQLKEDTCTCMSREKPCKHLVFLMWHQQYRTRCSTLRNLYK